MPIEYKFMRLPLRKYYSEDKTDEDVTKELNTLYLTAGWQVVTMHGFPNWLYLVLQRQNP